MGEEDMLDHHIQTLSKQLEQKNKKIAALQS
jgi:chaperonin cofactor prefoldin